MARLESEADEYISCTARSIRNKISRSYIKFGVGRAMKDSGQEIRNGHITKEEGLSLIEKFDGEYPSKYEEEFYKYVDIDKNKFIDLCDKFRPDHIWKKTGNKWDYTVSPREYFKKNS